MVGHAVKAFGRLDVVGNSAGYHDLGSFEDTTIDSFRRQIETNFYGVVNVSKAVVPVLREQAVVTSSRSPRSAPAYPAQA